MDGTIHWYLPTAKRQKMVRTDRQTDRQTKKHRDVAQTVLESAFHSC